MSRKRKKANESEVTSPSVSEGVPEDILAEGSGPVQAVARVAIATDDQEPDPPVRVRRKAKKSEDVTDDEAVVRAVEDLRNSVEAVAAKSRTKADDEAEAVETADVVDPKLRKGKKSKADAVEAESAVDDDEVVEAADVTVEAKPSKSRKGKKSKAADEAADSASADAVEAVGDEAAGDEAVEAAGDEAVEAASDEAVEAAGDEAVEAADVTVETKPSKSRKGKKSKVVADESLSADRTSSEAESIEATGDEAVEAAGEAVGATGDEAVEAAGDVAVETKPSKRKGKKSKTAKAADETTDGEAIEVADRTSVDGESIEASGDGESLEASRESLEASSEDDESVASGESVEASGEDGESVEASGEQLDGEASGEQLDGEAVEASGELDGGSVEGAAEGSESLDAAADGAAVDGAPAEGEEAEGVAALPTSAIALDAAGLKQLVEALVFASDKPMTVQKLRQLTRVSDIPRLEQALFELADDYADRGIVLQQVSGGYQFRTRTQWSQWVQQLIAGRPVRLTRAQLETLAIVAYRQPITRPEIDEIRGVDSSATLKLLMDRQLIRILGKKEEVGRPMLYGTTKEFLDFFSLGDLRELPTLREYSELTPESRQVITDKLGDLPDDDGSGNGGPMGEGGMGGDPSGSTGSSDSSDLGAEAAEPTAADLIAKYVAELDAETAREDNAERDARDARIEDDERMVFDVLDDELDVNTRARGSSPDLDAELRDTDDSELTGLIARDAVPSPDANGELGADASALDANGELASALDANGELGANADASVLDASGADGPDASSDDNGAAGDSIDAPLVAPEVVADDAAVLADAILAMDPSTEELSSDAASPAAVVAAARLANDAAELADAILTSPDVTDDLAFDLSDASTARIGDQPEPEQLHDGSLVELDPFTQERDAAEASIGDAFVGQSLVAEADRVAAATAAAPGDDVPAAVAEVGDAFVAASILESETAPMRLAPTDEAFIARDVDEIPPALDDAAEVEAGHAAVVAAIASMAAGAKASGSASDDDAPSMDADALSSSDVPSDSDSDLDASSARTTSSDASSDVEASGSDSDLDASSARAPSSDTSGDALSLGDVEASDFEASGDVDAPSSDSDTDLDASSARAAESDAAAMDAVHPTADAVPTDAVRELFAHGSAGTVGGGPGATPSVDLDEWPSGSGGFAARATMDPRPHADEDDSSDAIRTRGVDPDADADVDAVPDPVE